MQCLDIGIFMDLMALWVSVLNQTPQLMLVADKAHRFLHNEHQGIPQRINIQITSPSNQKQVS